MSKLAKIGRLLVSLPLILPPTLILTLPTPVVAVTPPIVTAVYAAVPPKMPTKSESIQTVVVTPTPAPSPPRSKAVATPYSPPISSYTALPGMKVALASRYVYGANQPGVAVDCSALTQYISRLRGHSIPRSSAAQIRSLRHISMAEALPGDVIAFNYGHVGVYLGGGMVLQALNPAQGVQVTPLSEAIKWNGYLTALKVQ